MVCILIGMKERMWSNIARMGFFQNLGGTMCEAGITTTTGGRKVVARCLAPRTGHMIQEIVHNHLNRSGSSGAMTNQPLA